MNDMNAGRQERKDIVLLVKCLPIQKGTITISRSSINRRMPAQKLQYGNAPEVPPPVEQGDVSANSSIDVGMEPSTKAPVFNR